MSALVFYRDVRALTRRLTDMEAYGRSVAPQVELAHDALKTRLEAGHGAGEACFHLTLALSTLVSEWRKTGEMKILGVACILGRIIEDEADAAAAALLRAI